MMGKLTARSIACIVLSLAVGASAGSPTPRESVDVQNLYVVGTSDMTRGAVTLTRDFVNNRLNAAVTSMDLMPDDAYSIWWVIFNYPQFCATPHACTGADIAGSPQVKASAIWAGGFIADAFGHANASIGLVKGGTQREVLAGTDVGLLNLRGGEIHVVLRTHGTAGIAGSVADQIGTANMACPPSGCMNKFFSVHQAN